MALADEMSSAGSQLLLLSLNKWNDLLKRILRVAGSSSALRSSRKFGDKYRKKEIKEIGNKCGSSPQLGGSIIAASHKAERRWMKRHRLAVSFQRGDACRSTAIRIQQPQLGGPVIAASRKIRRRWMKRNRVDTAAVTFQLGDNGDACRR